jgi:NAD-dependent deacetylase
MSTLVTVLTGAGISADSGLPTFRGEGGLWKGHDARKLATTEAWEQNPERVLEFYNYRRRLVAQADPNEAHKALSQLEDAYDVVIVTQNIDDLHERAGSQGVWHLHGNITKARSVKDDDTIIDIGYEDIERGDTAEDGGQLRPHVVWFGERVHNLEASVNRVRKTDIIIVIGTSLQVYPAAGLADQAPGSAEKYVVDPSIPALKDDDWNRYPEKAADGVPKVVHTLLNK